MTVARLCESILLPVSSSTCENDAAQLRKEKSTSSESRCAFGSKQQVRCNSRSRLLSSVISMNKESVGSTKRVFRRRGPLTLRCREETV